MGRITEDIRDRLTAALSVTVLLPEQLREPLDAAPLDALGRPAVGAGERGLSAYLTQHPGGYVQIEQPMPITSDGLTGTYWVAVASVHTSPDGAASLAQQVRRALTGFNYAPGRYRQVTPAQPQQLTPGVWMMRPTYETKTIDGGTTP